MNPLTYISIVLAVVCFTTTESVGTRMRREHVEWWNALLEDFQQQVSRAMTSVVENCACDPYDTNFTHLLLETINSENNCCKQLNMYQEDIIRRMHFGQNLTQIILEEMQQMRSEIKPLTDMGFSCKEIAERKPNSFSGFYWLQTCPPVQVYCDLEKSFSTGTKGWLRVANFNMKDPNQQCPPNFRLYTQPKRLCGKSTNGNGCDSVKFTTNGLQYNKVCGRVVGYQFQSPDAFVTYCSSHCSINEAYVDGVSITHGSPRKHIWTLAAGVVETTYKANHCPCSSSAGKQPPSFVGSDYYCESGLYRRPWTATVYENDVLWDGEGCDANEAPCCNPPDLPWFCKELPEPTSDDLEVRICTNQPLSDEDVPLEVIELYVQ